MMAITIKCRISAPGSKSGGPLLADGISVEACAEAKAFAGEIKAELEKRGLLGEKLGLGSFDGTAREALVNAGVKNIVDTRNLMLEARMVKNQDEIGCLKTCAAMVDGVWFRIWENLKRDERYRPDDSRIDGRL